MPANQSNEIVYESSLTMASLFGFLGAVALGTLAAVVLLPNWVPNLAQSLVGNDPKAYWYLSRGSAFVSLGLLWISMALGLLITNKIARTWPGAPAAFAIHEYVSLLGLAFAVFHALVIMGDHYINFQLTEILIPFATLSYRPNWVGLGQLGFYIWVILSASFYVRQRIGPKVWRFLHYASFFTFLMALFHGLTSGTDTSMPWAQNLYWFLGGSLIFLVMYRIVSSLFPQAPSAPPRSAAQQSSVQK
jgi:predicted ferric reductase